MIPIDITKPNIIEAREHHIELLLPKVLEEVSKSTNQKIKSILKEDKIKSILGGLPEELLQLNQ